MMNATAVVGEETVLWRRLDGAGIEHCLLTERQGEMLLVGTVVVSENGPWRIEYEVRCDEAWRTRTVTIFAQAGMDRRKRVLERDRLGHWMLDGELRPELQGCVDADLGFSPSTNTLPIRRLRLDVQQSAEIEAAWVEFPSLAVRRVSQRYTRLDDRTYRYENLPSGFSADVTVDGRGLVIAYPPGWERVDRVAETPLFSPSAADELGEAATLYRDLIGRWDVEVIDYEDDGNRRTSQGEWHFAWALEGRAIQDVFIAPRRGYRSETEARPGDRYGTTIRFYDRARQKWRIVWINPVSGAVNSLVARQEGEVIVQEGVSDAGLLMRWSFISIEPDRFHWRGEESNDGGATWRTRAEFFGRRASFEPLR